MKYKDINTRLELSTYNAWRQMRYRCQNSSCASYWYYGGRGITICSRWIIFENFFDDMGVKPSNKHSLDRIDNDGNYEPSNCRWATRTEQMKNSRPRGERRTQRRKQYANTTTQE